MRFKRPRNRYGDTPTPVTPYQKAAQVWDERLGSAGVQAKNWRLMAFGSLSLSLVLSGGIIWQVGQSRVVPYVIELEREGAARAVKPATKKYSPSDAQIAFHLGRFVEWVRSLPADPVIVRTNWLMAYDYAAARAAKRLNDYARDVNPFARVGKETVAVDVTSVVRASSKSFQIRWSERLYQNGALLRTTRWTALASILLEPPKDIKTLQKNPLGIYLTDLNWSRDRLRPDGEEPAGKGPTDSERKKEQSHE